MDGVVSIGAAMSNEAAVLVDNRFTIGPGTASSPDQVTLHDLKQRICRVPHGVARVALTCLTMPLSSSTKKCLSCSSDHPHQPLHHLERCKCEGMRVVDPKTQAQCWCRRHPISWGGVERSRCPLRQQVGHPLFFFVTLESAVE